MNKGKKTKSQNMKYKFTKQAHFQAWKTNEKDLWGKHEIA